MKKTVLVFGAGRMGLPTAIYLHKLGHNVVAVDTNLSQDTKNKLNDYAILAVQENFHNYEYIINLYAPHAVVSCLPYYCNKNLFDACNKTETDYFDLGGKVSNTEYINSNAKNITVFTDLGLAPGLINIYAEHQRQNAGDAVKGIKCFVGGIPLYALDPPFNYHCTWSISGLMNEYVDDVVILRDSKEEIVRGMDEPELVYSHYLQKKLEAFLTSGASAHSIKHAKQVGLRDFEYKTLRYIGHRKYIQHLLDHYEFNEVVDVVGLASKTAPIKEDVVICIVKLFGFDSLIIGDHEFVITGSHEFSAMQRATAGPLAAVVDMKLCDILGNGVLNYSDVANKFKQFEERVVKLDEAKSIDTN